MRNFILVLVILNNFLFCREIFDINKIRDEYSIMFGVRVDEYQDNVFISPILKELPKNHYLSNFVKENKFHLSYLFSNTINNEKLEFLKSLKDDSAKL